MHHEATLHVDPQFRQLIDPEDLGRIDASSNTIYGVWSDFRLALTNRAWLDFARENGADADFYDRFAVGKSIAAIFTGPGGDLFREACENAMSDESVQTASYECSSSETYRMMHANIFPLGKDACLLSHAVVEESTHDDRGRESYPPDTARFEDENGLVAMCSGCRCVRVPDRPDQWVWVPAYVDEMPARVTHGMCPACMAYWMSPVPTSKKKF